MSLLEPMDDEQLDAMIAALEAERLSQIKALQEEVARLRLTHAEREAVDYFSVIHAVDGEPLCNHAATLRGLLERTGGER